MKRILLLLTFLQFFIFQNKANLLSGNLLITSKMDGSQEVPSVAGNAQGIVSLLLNSTRDSICINGTVTGLSGPITGAHIHEGDSGINGPVVISLMPFLSGNRISGLLTNPDISTAVLSKLLSGKFYINIHTSANPNGEIRGQLELETDYTFPLNLGGNQEVPPVFSAAYGTGFLTLAKDFSNIRFNLVMQNLSGDITGAHLHFGSAGITGTVALNLTDNINGKVLSGSIPSPSALLIDSLMKSKIYLNVHTAANPDGEIRSQLEMGDYLYFDAVLNGNQEVPPVATNARGSAVMMLNTSFDTLWYDIAVEGLSGPVTGAHFHHGAFSSSGPVLISLISSLSGNRITGQLSGTTLSTDLINKFLRGEIYLNVHTSANPQGEIRGQVYSTAREGFTFSMDGAQEVPAVNSNANGSGIVSLPRDGSNAHFMFVADGINITGVHFHSGAKGQTGPVIFNLGPFMQNNSGFGYWRNTDSIPFDSTAFNLFKNDSVYINLHSATYPEGEIRGQVTRDYSCYGFISGEFPIQKSKVKTTIYPNPSSHFLIVEFSEKAGLATIVIHDVPGNKVYSALVKLSSDNHISTIDMASLPDGLYFIEIKIGDEIWTRKFIKS